MPDVMLGPMTRPSKVPKPLRPMLATLIDAPFDAPDWVFETKWDDFRLIASVEKRRVTLYSRSGLIVSDELQADRQGSGEGEAGRRYRW